MPTKKSAKTSSKQAKTTDRSARAGLKGESFYEQVYAIVEQIPKGRVTSYGAIAKCLGSGLSARMVGWAMNAAHAKPGIQAQRVVNRNGQLSGKMHFKTPTRMEELLKKDGVQVKDDTIIDFQNIFWDPAKELAF